MVSESPEFKAAVKDSKNLKAQPSNDELLELYALFKIGNGVDVKTADKPGMFDLKGKAKLSAWQKMADKDFTPEEAQKKYVELVESLKEKYGF